MPLTPAQFHASDGVDDWRSLYLVVSAHFRTESFAQGVPFAAAIARLDADPAPRVDLRQDGVTVTLTRRDADVARAISAAAAELGLTADPSAVQVVNVMVDALSIPQVLPFWRALLGYRAVGDDFLSDPHGRGPGIDFQTMDVPRPHRNRLHIDVAVPHEQAETRIAAALAAGGHLVSDAHAPKWWTLADPEGNEACVATWRGRGT